MTKTISEITNCTGCGACQNICPHQAIRMVENAEGFLYPQIDLKKCVGCGLCYTKCSATHPVFANTAKPICLAVAADDASRAESSSGAVFTLLARNVLANPQGGG